NSLAEPSFRLDRAGTLGSWVRFHWPVDPMRASCFACPSGFLGRLSLAGRLFNNGVDLTGQVNSIVHHSAMSASVSWGSNRSCDVSGAPGGGLKDRMVRLIVAVWADLATFRHALIAHSLVSVCRFELVPSPGCWTRQSRCWVVVGSCESLSGKMRVRLCDRF